MQRQTTVVLFFVLVVGGLLQGPTLIGRALANLGMIAFRDTLLSEATRSDTRLRPGVYPLFETLPKSEVESQIAVFQRAVTLDRNSVTIRWGLGRVALAAGDAVTAAEAMRPIAGQSNGNLLLHQDAWIAFSKGRMFDQIILFYETTPPPEPLAPSPFRPLDPPLPARVVNDTVALAYLEVEGQEALEKVRQLRSQDLYAAYHLWEKAKQTGDLAAAMAYRETLTHFSLEAILPTDERLLNYTAEVVPALLDEELWDRDKTLRVVSFLIWSQNSAVDVEGPLKRLIERYPNEPEWSFYLAEFYRLRGRLEASEEAYRQTLAVDPQYARAYLQLGMVIEARCRMSGAQCQDDLREAIGWYELYHKMAPDDLVGLKRLEEAYESLGLAANESEDMATPQEEWLQQVAQQGPAVVVSQTLESGWTFLGYRGDEERLVRGEPTSLWLYWQGPAESVAGDEREGWYALGKNQWIYVLEDAYNLIFDSGFDLSVAEEAPISFPYDIYEADPTTRKLGMENREGIQTAVALLENSNVYSRTSFASLYMPVEPDALYLQAGWVLSRGGKAYLGRRWAGSIPRAVKRYSYVAFNANPEIWQHYAGIAQSLPGSEWVQVWLLNYNATGRTYFDDVLFVKIGKPGE